MNKSSMRGIFLSVTLLFSALLIVIPSNVHAEEINVEGIALEETTIIELINDSDKEVSTLRIWLARDSSFESFKTENGWVGEKTSQGIIIFTSSESIKPGESVKFGIKTDKAKLGINWKALDENNEEMSIGKVLPKEIGTEKIEKKEDKGPSIAAESKFRIIPEKPNVGSSIRVTGDKFGPSQELDFYIDSEKIGSFTTDENGNFITTMKIPEGQKAERVDFKVKAKNGEEKKISIIIGENSDRDPPDKNIELAIKGIPDIVRIGDSLEISGTGEPSSAITATITTAKGKIINSRTAEVDSKGNWKLDKPVIIPLDIEVGEYIATITDGRQSISKEWTVKSNKVIIIAPSNLKFAQGEIMKFNGTAQPNQQLEIILEDPLENEIFSDIFQVDESGLVKFEYETEATSMKGTYTVIATQGKDKEFIYVGVGQLPAIPVNVKFDKLVYKEGDTAIISMTGKAYEIVSLLVIDPADKPKGRSISITLQPDGTRTHDLDLSGYSFGMHTAVLSKGSAQSSETFIVGSLPSCGKIQIHTTKDEYVQRDPILILGKTNEKCLLTLSLIDPDGNKIKSKETIIEHEVTDKEEGKTGRISEKSFRIPSDGKPGKWTIKAESGPNFDTHEIEVRTIIQEGMVITVTESPKLDGVNDFINIHVYGAVQAVKIEIIAEDEEVIASMDSRASGTEEIDLPWRIPKDTEPGTYTIKVTDAHNSTETTFEVR